MLKEVIHRMGGQLHIQVECAFPERMLNLCGAWGLALWDLQWQGPTALSCRISRRDWKQFQQLSRRLDGTVTVLRREGAPYFLRRFRRRQTLLTGLTLLGFALLFGSFFVWDYEIEGNRTVPEEVILRALEKNGVRLGSFGLGLDGEDIRNHVLLDVPQLCWLSVNVSGCRAHVQVRERIFPPEIMDERTPTNVVARRAGVVTQLQASDGIACVLKGSTVSEGQLLISGVEDLDTFGARVMAGMGSVQARTWYTLRTVVPLKAMEKRYTGKEDWGLSLIVGTHRIKFFQNSSILHREYDKITKRYPLRLLGISLPLTLEREQWRFYETAEVPQGEQERQAAMEKVLTDYLHSLVDPYGTVRSTLCTARRRGDFLSVTLSAECEEQIARQVPIIKE